MSYIGRGLDAISNVEKLDNITFDGSATYALEKSSVAYTPSGANNILISIDGVVQQGNFSVSTTNIVFDWSPTSSNTCDWILHFGTGVLNIPADGSVSAAKMAANSVDSDAYVDGSIDLAHMSSESVDEDNLHISNAGSNDQFLQKQSGNAGGLTWASAGFDVSSITGATALGATPADTDEFVLSDAGVLKRVDYSYIKGGDNTPSFLAVSNAVQTGFSLSTFTKVTLQTEVYDTDSAFATSRFTVPSGKDGKYLITFSGALQSGSDYDEARLAVYKNGAIVESIESRNRTASNYLKGGSSQRYSGAGILDLSAADYIELYGLLGGAGTPQFNDDCMSLSATRLIGV